MKVLLVICSFALTAAMQLPHSPNTGKPPKDAAAQIELPYYLKIEIQAIINKSKANLKLDRLDALFDETSFVVPRKYIINEPRKEHPLLDIPEKSEINGKIIIPLNAETEFPCDYFVSSALLQIANVKAPDIRLLLYIRKSVWPILKIGNLHWALYENPQSNPLSGNLETLDWDTCHNTLLALKISNARKHSKTKHLRPYLIAPELFLVKPDINILPT